MSAPGDPLGRALVLGLALTLLLALAGVWVFERFAVEAPPSVVVAPVAEPAAGGARGPVAVASVATSTQVVEVVGPAERTRGRGWVELTVGDALAPDDSVRTGPGARVGLRLGDDASRLFIPERSEVHVGEVTRSVHTIRLEHGRLDVDYRAQEDRVLRVQSQGGAVAETREARFTMLRHGVMVAVVTRGGSVDLSAAGATVRVGEGQQSVVFDGATPLAAETIPLEVLLKVAEKTPARDSLCLSLLGQVHVGSEVWVGGEPVEVSREGTFRMEVARHPGEKLVTVRAREPAGAEREVRVACRVHRGSPPIESVKFHWKEAP